MTRLLALLLLAALVACGNTPPVPDWQLNAKGSMERAQDAYLRGDTRIEDNEFARARSAVASTGRADLLARLELTRCAWRVASLVFDPCTAYTALAQDGGASEAAYAAYLAGQATPTQAPLLPEQHRAMLQTGQPAAQLAAVSDPLARLVAAAVLLQQGRADPAAITLAIATASEQGWRRPLLAWLGVQAQRAEQAGDREEAERVRRRMGLLGPGRP